MPSRRTPPRSRAGTTRGPTVPAHRCCPTRGTAGSAARAVLSAPRARTAPAGCRRSCRDRDPTPFPRRRCPWRGTAGAGSPVPGGPPGSPRARGRGPRPSRSGNSRRVSRALRWRRRWSWGRRQGPAPRAARRGGTQARDDAWWLLSCFDGGAAGGGVCAGAEFALGEVVERTAGDVGDVDVVVLGEGAQHVLPDLLLGDAALPRLHQIPHGEQDTGLPHGGVDGGSEVRVEDHELAGRFAHAFFGGFDDVG